jgi:S1-C subfamily serine protease
LCPRCEGLTRRHFEVLGLVTELESITLEIKQIAAPPNAGLADLPGYRGVIARIGPYKAQINDSPELLRGMQVLEARMSAVWSATLKARRLSEDERRQLGSDLERLGASLEERNRIVNQLELSGTLVERGPRSVRDEVFQKALLASVGDGALDRLPKSVAPIHSTARAQLVGRVLDSVRDETGGPDVVYSDIIFTEILLKLLPEERQAIAPLVARGYAARAQQLAGLGRGAALALLYVDRARRLGGTEEERKLEAITAVAEASFATAGRMPLRVRVDTNPSDDPVLQDLVRIAVSASVRRKARPHVQLKLIDVDGGPADIDISVLSIAMLVPSVADLSTVSSTYLSHFEDVPNPLKQVLKVQLASQRIAVNYAESSLQSAISSFNIYPTDFGLMTVNNARTRYSMEVDRYNLLVRQYNATPDTMSRPVYLPYSFREGTVRNGWRLTGKVSVGSQQESFSIEEVDGDFVRLGTRPDDREVRYRRDDPLDIPVGPERLVVQLVKVADRLVEKLARSMAGLRIEVRSDLALGERELLGVVLHPFLTPGEGRAGAGLEWTEDSLRRVALPKIADSVVPTIRIPVPTRHVGGTTPEQIAGFYGPCVALIFSGKGAVGSGALISPDGLVLTAAHVLVSDGIEVVFPANSREKRYRGEVVFVNEMHDVAVIRLPGYRSDRWFEVALSEAPRPGEPVVAMGNPSIREAGTAVTAVSKGIVAKPYEAEGQGGLKGLVADIAVASGSSGGPLISQRTGKIIGVVTAVVAPTVSKDFATSGYWAVAAPSTELQGWLGITYSNR